LARGRIADSSPLAVANTFVRHMQWQANNAQCTRAYVGTLQRPAHVLSQMYPYPWGPGTPT